MRTYDIGILGGGQLARMSIQAAQRMGLHCISLDPSADSPASQIAPSICGDLNEPNRIAELVGSCERVTLENEFVPAPAIVAALERCGRPREIVVPGALTLSRIQDKLDQRRALAAAGVASPSALELKDSGEAISEIGFPMVLKARFGGYDGKGTRYARSAEELEIHRPLWSSGGWLAEEFVPFRRELAVMVIASAGGYLTFPTVETVQVHHVCDLVFPAGVDASEIAIGAIRAVEGKGLFGVELFELEDGSFAVNEIAPRPHNTGHYTLDWGGPSQFEAHVRVVMGLPPIEPVSASFAVMANLLGREGGGDFRNGIAAALEVDGARFHWYGKSEMRPGRKMGHINVVARAGEAVSDVVARAALSREWFYAALDVHTPG